MTGIESPLFVKIQYDTFPNKKSEPLFPSLRSLLRTVPQESLVFPLVSGILAAIKQNKLNDR